MLKSRESRLPLLVFRSVAYNIDFTPYSCSTLAIYRFDGLYTVLGYRMPKLEKEAVSVFPGLLSKSAPTCCRLFVNLEYSAIGCRLGHSSTRYHRVDSKDLQDHVLSFQNEIYSLYGKAVGPETSLLFRPALDDLESAPTRSIRAKQSGEKGISTDAFYTPPKIAANVQVTEDDEGVIFSAPR